MKECDKDLDQLKNKTQILPAGVIRNQYQMYKTVDV